MSEDSIKIHVPKERLQEYEIFRSDVNIVAPKLPRYRYTLIKHHGKLGFRYKTNGHEVYIVCKGAINYSIKFLAWEQGALFKYEGIFDDKLQLIQIKKVYNSGRVETMSSTPPLLNKKFNPKMYRILPFLELVFVLNGLEDATHLHGHRCLTYIKTDAFGLMIKTRRHIHTDPYHKHDDTCIIDNYEPINKILYELYFDKAKFLRIIVRHTHYDPDNSLYEHMPLEFLSRPLPLTESDLAILENI